jgi:hypothetical protein
VAAGRPRTQRRTRPRCAWDLPLLLLLLLPLLQGPAAAGTCRRHRRCCTGLLPRATPPSPLAAVRRPRGQRPREHALPGSLQPSAARGPPWAHAAGPRHLTSGPRPPPPQWRRIHDDGGWPFQRLCDRLTVDMVDQAWEVRHGACLALREVLGAQSASAAVQAPPGKQPAGWLIAGTAGAPPSLRLHPAAHVLPALALSSAMCCLRWRSAPPCAACPGAQPCPPACPPARLLRPRSAADGRAGALLLLLGPLQASGRWGP